MAIKGKKKPRGGTTRGAPLAPKPRVEARKPPLVKRSWFRRAFIGSIVLLVVFTLLTVAGRIHRADAVRAYDDKLSNAERPFRASTEPGPQSMSSVITDFAAGHVPTAPARADQKTWEDNFTSAAADVRALQPPTEAQAANKMIAAALDEYTAAARAYVAIAQERDLQTATKDKALQAKIGNQVTLYMTNVQDMRNRADSLMQLARQQIDDLKKRWGVHVSTPAPASSTGVSGGTSGLPGGTSGLPGGVTS